MPSIPDLLPLPPPARRVTGRGAAIPASRAGHELCASAHRRCPALCSIFPAGRTTRTPDHSERLGPRPSLYLRLQRADAALTCHPPRKSCSSLARQQRRSPVAAGKRATVTCLTSRRPLDRHRPAIREFLADIADLRPHVGWSRLPCRPAPALRRQIALGCISRAARAARRLEADALHCTRPNKPPYLCRVVPPRVPGSLI